MRRFDIGRPGRAAGFHPQGAFDRAIRETEARLRKLEEHAVGQHGFAYTKPHLDEIVQDVSRGKDAEDDIELAEEDARLLRAIMIARRKLQFLYAERDQGRLFDRGRPREMSPLLDPVEVDRRNSRYLAHVEESKRRDKIAWAKRDAEAEALRRHRQNLQGLVHRAVRVGEVRGVEESRVLERISKDVGAEAELRARVYEAEAAAAAKTAALRADLDAERRRQKASDAKRSPPKGYTVTKEGSHWVVTRPDRTVAMGGSGRRGKFENTKTAALNWAFADAAKKGK